MDSDRTNDLPTIGNPSVSTLTEDSSVNVSGNLVATGTISITDADANQSSFSTTVVSAQGNLGTLTLAADGTYSYSVANSAVQYLGTGDTKVDTFTITSTDGTTKNVSFTINGVNDLPVLTGTASTLVDGAEDTSYIVTRAQLLAGWTDAENQTLLVVDPSVTNGSISAPDANGNYTITPSANYNGPITINYTVSDGSAGGASSYSTNGLVGLYRFNDANNLGLDSSGLGNNLVDKGQSLVQYTSLGQSGGGAYFPSSFAYLSTSDGKVPTGFPLGNSSYTFSVWFKDMNGTNTEGLIGYGNYGSANTVNALKLDGNGRVTNYWWSNDLDANTPAYGTSFHNVVASYDGTTRSIYFDGVLIGTSTTAGHNVQNANFAIGVTNTSEYFSGVLDDVAVYNRALSAAEVQSIAQGSLGGTAASLTLNLAAVNDAPVAVADVYAGTAVVEAGSGVSGQPAATGNVLTNDTDVDAGDTRTVTNPGTLTGTYGSLVLNANGSYTYTLDDTKPATEALTQGQQVNEVFNYTMKDTAGLTSSSTLTIAITGTNDAPLAVADVYSGTAVVEAGSIITGQPTATGNVLTNDSDVDAGDTKTITNPGTIAGAYGSLVLNANGTYTYTLDDTKAATNALAQDQQVSETFNYTIRDAAGATSSSTLTIGITGSNDAPVAVNDVLGPNTAGFAFNDATGHFYYASTNFTSYSNVQAEAASRGGYLATITDAAENDFVWNLIKQQSLPNGFVTIQYWLGATSAGNANWTWNAGPESGASVAYRNFGGGEGSDSPVFDILGYRVPALGMSWSSGQWVDYTTNFAGRSVTEIGGRATDVYGIEDRTVTVSTTLLTANDTDVDTNTLTVTAVSAATSGGATLSLSNGIISLDATGPAYQALKSGEGRIETFTYTVSDGKGGTSVGTATITIYGTNDGPVAVADVYAGTAVVEAGSGVTGQPTATGNVLTNDTDVDAGDTRTVTNPGTLTGTYGTLVLNANGSYTYTLDDTKPATEALTQGQQVNEVFNYTMKDSAGATSSSTLTITITGSNDNGAPVAVADVYAGTAVVEAGSGVTGQPTATGNVLTNDTDVDAGDTKTVTNPGTIAGTYGTLVLNADGSYTYTLDDTKAATQALTQGQQVSEVFNYTMKDTAGLTSSSTLTIGITGTNDAPLVSVVAETATGNEDTAITGTLLAGSDVDSSNLTFQIVAGTATNGSVTITNAATGAYSFTPSVNYNGPASFQYVITDGTTTSTAKTVSVTVNAVADAPTILANPATAVGSDVLVNTTSTDTQSWSTVTALTGGGYVVTWTSAATTGTDIYQRVYSSSGVGGAETRANSYTNGYQIYSSTIAMPDGGYVSAWTSSFQDGDNFGVFARRFSADGSPIFGEIQLASSTVGAQHLVNLTPLGGVYGAGSFVAVWSDNHGTANEDIRLRIIDSNFNTVGTEISVNTYTTGRQDFPTVTRLANGSFVVAWMSLDQDGDSWGVYQRRYDASGTALDTTESQIAATTVRQQGYVSLAALGTGYVATWINQRVDGQFDINFRRFDANGNAIDATDRTASISSTTEAYPAVLQLNNGGFLISWSSNNTSGSGFDVIAQRYDANGNAVGTNFIVNSTILGDQNLLGWRSNPLTQLSDGSIVFVWTDGNTPTTSETQQTRFIRAPSACHLTESRISQFQHPSPPPLQTPTAPRHFPSASPASRLVAHLMLVPCRVMDHG